jgi:biotin-(acetyl-CoA carboxylase) ligase
MSSSVENKKVADIFGLLGDTVSRSCVAGRLLFYSIQLFEDWKTVGFSAFLNNWQEVDYLYNKRVKVSLGQDEFIALGAGIDSDGALLVKYNNRIKRISSAQVRVLA